VSKRQKIEVYCVGCGVDIRARARNVQPHCNEPECIEAYCLSVIEARGHRDGEHFILPANRPGGEQTSIVAIVNGKRVGYRAIDILFRQETGETSDGRRYRNRCGVPDCIAPAHNEVERSEESGKRIKLPVEPLERAMFFRGFRGFGDYHRSQQKGWSRSRTRGWIDMALADEICCDFLRCHPYEVYGELYYTVEPEVREVSTEFRCGHPKVPENCWSRGGNRPPKCKTCERAKAAAA